MGAEGGGRNLKSELPLKAGCALSSAWGAGLGGEAAGTGASSCPNPTASRAPDPAALLHTWAASSQQQNGDFVVSEEH